jgi:hypothetical protein
VFRPSGTIYEIKIKKIIEAEIKEKDEMIKAFDLFSDDSPQTRQTVTELHIDAIRESITCK